MNNHNNENLDELLKRFFDAGEAKEAARDFAEGERILREYPAPPPSEKTIAMAKARVAKALSQSSAKTSSRIFYRIAAVAAAIIVISGLSIMLLENKPAENYKVATTVSVAQGISESDEFFNDDTAIETLNAEIKQVDNEIATSEWENTSDNIDSDLINAEINLLDIDSDFWKG